MVKMTAAMGMMRKIAVRRVRFSSFANTRLFEEVSIFFADNTFQILLFQIVSHTPHSASQLREGRKGSVSLQELHADMHIPSQMPHQARITVLLAPKRSQVIQHKEVHSV